MSRSDELRVAEESGDVKLIARVLRARHSQHGRVITPLHRAAERGDLDEVRRLVGNGAKVNARGPYGELALHCAAQQGHVEVLRYLVSQGTNVNDVNEDEKAAIHYAAEHCHVEAMRYLVACGVDVNVRTLTGTTPLFYAAKDSHMNAMCFLVEESKADVNATNNLGRTPFYDASSRGQLNTMRYLAQHGAQVHIIANGGFPPLYHAASQNVESVEFLVELGADVNKQNPITGKSPLHVAASEGNVDVVEYLVEHGANVNVIDEDGGTPLDTSVFGAWDNDEFRFRQYKISRALCKSGATPSDLFGREFQRVCSALNRGDVMRRTNARWQAGLCACVLRWMKQCRRGEELAEVRMEVIERGNMSVESYLEKLKTPLIEPAQSGDLDAVKTLVAIGHAHVDAKDSQGWTALMHAVVKRHDAIVRYLAMEGADILYASDAFIQNDAELVQRILKCGVNLNQRGRTGELPLIVAAKKHSLGLVKTLLDHGAHAFCLDERGNNVLSILLQRDDNPDQNAVRPIALQLLSKGMSTTTLNNDALSAKMLARRKSYTEVEELLDNHAREGHWHIGGSASLWMIPSDELVTGTIITRTNSSLVCRATYGGETVIMKKIDLQKGVDKAAELRRFNRELDVWVTLRHPRIVQCLGTTVRGQEHFLVSVYAEEGTLIEYLRVQPCKDSRLVWKKLLEVANAVKFVHGKGIVHADLKGNNIVVNKSGDAMLTDFGMSFFNASAMCSLQRRDRKEWLGAMQWRAPEFLPSSNERPEFDSDVYSLGMCIIQAVKLADYPWGDRLKTDLVHDIMDEMIRAGKARVIDEKPKEMRDDQWDLVSKMISFRREERPPMDFVVEKLTGFTAKENPYKSGLQTATAG